MTKARTAAAAGLIACLALLPGCAGSRTVAQSRVAGPASQSPSPDTPVLGEKTRSVFASFQTTEEGKYEILVSAGFDIPLHRTFVTAAGELHMPSGDLYYVASAADDSAHVGETIDLHIADTLASATLSAVVVIESCTDEDGRPVADSRCPVGRSVDIKASWQSSKAMEYLGLRGVDGEHPGRGRLCSATGTIGSETYKSAEYALIVENDTIQ